MRFTDLVAQLRELDLDDEGAHGRRPPRDNVRTIQHALTAMLADDDFYLDCIELEMAAVLRRTPDRPYAPMFRMRGRAQHFRMFYWAPGRVAPPHEHTAWTVTAVFYNALEVTTYDWDHAVRERRLERKNVFTATQGAAGHIYERCIHNPANPGRRFAASIHIFNDSDQPRIEREIGPIEGMANPTPPFVRGPDEVARLEDMKQRQLRALAKIAGERPSERARRIVRTIARSGDDRTRMIADRIAWASARGERCTFSDARTESGGSEAR